ncbi:hypothetical protein BST61_g2194 [Cercospora zeina]
MDCAGQGSRTAGDEQSRMSPQSTSLLRSPSRWSRDWDLKQQTSASAQAHSLPPSNRQAVDEVPSVPANTIRPGTI